MARSRTSQNRKTNPIYYVFCEGKSEEEYIKTLKQFFRKPIKIKIEQKNVINKSKIDSYLQQEKFDKSKDRIFLMYDLDIKNTLENLQEVEKKYKTHVILLVSNPCFELWYLLHFQNYVENDSSKDVENALRRYVSNYQKGEVPENLDKQSDAIRRATKLNLYNNPSTSVYKLIEILKKL